MLCVSRGCLPSLPAQSCRSHTTGPCKGRPIAERFDEASPSLEADPTIMRALCAALPADLALVTFDPSHLKTLRQCAVLITESREAKLPRALESWGRRHAARVCQAHYRARLAAERQAAAEAAKAAAEDKFAHLARLTRVSADRRAAMAAATAAAARMASRGRWTRLGEQRQQAAKRARFEAEALTLWHRSSAVWRRAPGTVRQPHPRDFWRAMPDAVRGIYTLPRDNGTCDDGPGAEQLDADALAADALAWPEGAENLYRRWSSVGLSAPSLPLLDDIGWGRLSADAVELAELGEVAGVALAGASQRQRDSLSTNSTGVTASRRSSASAAPLGEQQGNVPDDGAPEKPHKKAVRTELRAMKDDLVEFILGPDYADRYPSATFLDVVVAAVAQVVERGFLTVAPKGAPFEQGRACLIAVNPNYATPAVPDPHATPHVRQ